MTTVQVILAVFDDENNTEAALKQLKAAKKGELPGIQAAVAMYKDADSSKFRYKEVGLTPGKVRWAEHPGRDPGYMTGGAGSFWERRGLAGQAGGAEETGKPLSADRINQVVASLPPGSSAILAVVADQDVAAVEKNLTAWAPIY
jgi:uncharacterized membrane protein